MKKIVIFLSLLVLLAGTTAGYVYAKSNDVSKGIVIEKAFSATEEKVDYTVDQVSISNSNEKEKGKYIIEVKITVDSKDEHEIVAPLAVSSDRNFQNKLDPDKIRSNDDSIIGVYYSDFLPETIFVKMPLIAKVTSDVVNCENVSFDEVNEYSGIIADKETNFLVLKYSEDEFPVFPRLLEIESQGEKVQCLFNDCWRDDNGNLLEGYYTFIKPEKFIVNDTYDVVILGTYENCSPVIAEIPVN